MSTEISDMIGRDRRQRRRGHPRHHQHRRRRRQHAVKDNADALFTWDYDLARPALRKLYEKAKTGQWNGQTDLPWETEVDQESAWSSRTPTAAQGGIGTNPDHYIGSPVEKWGDTGVARVRHPEPELDAEPVPARRAGRAAVHGQDRRDGAVVRRQALRRRPRSSTRPVTSRCSRKYLDTKLDGHYPINAHLRMLLDDIVNDSRWDMTYLGMQIMVEGLALAAFGFMHQITTEPLLKQLLRYVMSDEARHVAFGVLSLRRSTTGMTASRDP